jgi:predicted AAA+ superfamily ATPase
MSPYVPRSLEPILKRAASEFPAVVITGPRQSGKTTLLKHLFGQEYRYLSLELPDVRAAALEDPRSFLARFPPPVIFDEVQFAPELLPYVKERIDEERSRAGQFLLSGSQNLLLLEKVTESPAGRTAILRLLPLSRREIFGRWQAPLPWEENDGTGVQRSVPPEKLWREFLRGFYPELVTSPDRDIHLWHSGYVQTYLERDVRSLRQVGDLTQFQSFLRALAARTGQLLNLSDISRDLGVAANTAKAWLSVLEATHQIFILRPFHANIGKRLVKTPKVYFADPGIVCHLTGLKDPEHAASGPMAGPILETVVLTEILKVLTNRGMDPDVYFWRTSSGVEVDLLVQVEGRLIPLEVKKSATPRPSMADSIRAFQEDLGKRAGPGYLVHPGEGRLPMGAGVTALGLSEL